MSSPDDDLPRTYAWVCATDGALTGSQRRVLQSKIRSTSVDIVRGLAGWAFRSRRTVAPFPKAPDSRLARTAEEAAAEQSPAVRHHGFRSWLLGSAFAALDGAAPDPELFYITALLHDAGLSTGVPFQDFTRRSAQQVLDVCRRAGISDAGAVTAADAVVAHATPGLKSDEDVVGYYVQVGAMADLTGLRMWDLPRGFLRRAFQEYPAHGVHHELAMLIRREAAQVPLGRFALLRRYGVDKVVMVSPTRLYARGG